MFLKNLMHRTSYVGLLNRSCNTTFELDVDDDSFLFAKSHVSIVV